MHGEILGAAQSTSMPPYCMLQQHLWLWLWLCAGMLSLLWAGCRPVISSGSGLILVGGGPHCGV